MVLNNCASRSSSGLPANYDLKCDQFYCGTGPNCARGTVCTKGCIGVDGHPIGGGCGAGHNSGPPSVILTSLGSFANVLAFTRLEKSLQ